MYLLVFIQNLLVHLAKKILLMQHLTFRGDYPAPYCQGGVTRYLIENFFCKLKEFKKIAMRSDKTDTSFTAMIYATAPVINSR